MSLSCVISQKNFFFSFIIRKWSTHLWVSCVRRCAHSVHYHVRLHAHFQTRHTERSKISNGFGIVPYSGRKLASLNIIGASIDFKTKILCVIISLLLLLILLLYRKCGSLDCRFACNATVYSTTHRIGHLKRWVVAVVVCIMVDVDGMAYYAPNSDKPLIND